MTAVPVNPLTIKKGCGCFSFWYLNWGRPFKKGKERVCLCNAASSKTHPTVVKRRLCGRCRRPFVLTYRLSPIAVLTFYRAALQQLHLIAARCTLQHCSALHWSTAALQLWSTGAAAEHSQVHAAVLDFVQQQTETQRHLRLLRGGTCNSASLPLTPCLVWLRFFQMVWIFLFCAQGIYFWHLICEEEKSFFNKKIYSGNFFSCLKHIKNMN